VKVGRRQSRTRRHTPEEAAQLSYRVIREGVRRRRLGIAPPPSVDDAVVVAGRLLADRLAGLRDLSRRRDVTAGTVSAGGWLLAGISHDKIEGRWGPPWWCVDFHLPAYWIGWDEFGAASVDIQRGLTSALAQDRDSPVLTAEQRHRPWT